MEPANDCVNLAVILPVGDRPTIPAQQDELSIARGVVEVQLSVDHDQSSYWGARWGRRIQYPDAVQCLDERRELRTLDDFTIRASARHHDHGRVRNQSGVAASNRREIPTLRTDLGLGVRHQSRWGSAEPRWLWGPGSKRGRRACGCAGDRASREDEHAKKQSDAFEPIVTIDTCEALR